MRWEDERYVRLYTRDSPDWLALPWQARAVFHELLRKVDRAGILPMGKSRWRGVAAILHMPADVVELAMAELVADGCVTERDGVLLIPNFLAAQECISSDRARKQKSREMARASALSHTAGPFVTPSDHESQDVTESHARSHDVTRGHSVPCRAVPNLTKPEEEISSVSKPASSSHATPHATVEIFDHYVAGWHRAIGGRRAPVITQTRRKLASDRLKEGFSVADLCRACDGLWVTPWNMGDNPNAKKYTDFELVMRDAKHVEQFIASADDHDAKLREQAPDDTTPDTSGGGVPVRDRAKQLLRDGQPLDAFVAGCLPEGELDRIRAELAAEQPSLPGMAAEAR